MQLRPRRRLPGDVEIGGVGRRGAVLQHVVPPRVLVAEDAHVVGHDVEDLAQAVFVQGRDQRLVIRVRADFRVEALVVGDVVAVHAAGPRLQVRRGVQVRDAQVAQVRDDGRRVAEREALVELQAVGRLGQAASADLLHDLRQQPFAHFGEGVGRHGACVRGLFFGPHETVSIPGAAVACGSRSFALSSVSTCRVGTVASSGQARPHHRQRALLELVRLSAGPLLGRVRRVGRVQQPLPVLLHLRQGQQERQRLVVARSAAAAACRPRSVRRARPRRRSGRRPAARRGT